MKLFVLTLFLLAGACCNGFSQTIPGGGKFNLGVEADLTTGKASSTYNAGTGVSLKYEYRADTNFYFTLSAGYSNFGFTDNVKQALRQEGSSRSSAGFMPIKIGGKFYISQGFFGEVQLGNVFAINADRGATPSASAFAFSPGIGYVFNDGLEVGARYEGWFTNGLFSQYSFRLAYRFKL